MTSKKAFFEKFSEAAASVLPIVVIVAVMCLTFVPMDAGLMLSFMVGSIMLIVGMGLFTLGSEVSMTPIGTHMGAKLTKSRNLALILGVSLLLGIVVTVSEPDLTVLTATFMLPFAMGACTALGGNIMTDAFGLVTLVAMMPLITVQIMGLIYVLKTRRAEAVPEFAYADDEVIELWEVGQSPTSESDRLSITERSQRPALRRGMAEREV